MFQRKGSFSHNLSAVEAQGLAVTVVKSSFQPARLQVLSGEHGLPSLPAAEIRLHRTPSLSRAGTLLADHLSEAMQALPPVLSAR
ncbi:hypothetical protein GCM10007874_19410 [Labrys miyagiensis]|uniref:LysR substrate-binding domain-containing protein n=2 Tax=Labrys miyagiensis TaxID=346912 RepID=A0ABQ6CFA5_9HYPH|nr:hypothetical protein GCM10007874_19410 [Labrys miyagiensis]